MTRFRVIFAPSARRDLDRLPEKIAAAVLEFVFGALSENPGRVGKVLDPPLEPIFVARRGEYRVLYAIHDDVIEIEVVAVDHRRDIYRRR